jgi:hypothetical protein
LNGSSIDTPEFGTNGLATNPGEGSKNSRSQFRHEEPAIVALTASCARSTDDPFTAKWRFRHSRFSALVSPPMT